VRDAFRAALNADFPGQFLETLNTEPDTYPDEWITIAFPGGAVRRMSLGQSACFRESGQVEIWAFSKSGIGDTLAIAKADAVRDSLWARQLTPDIRVVDCDPPLSLTSDDGKWYGAVVGVSYTFDTYR